MSTNYQSVVSAERNRRVTLGSQRELATFCAKLPPNARVSLEPLLTEELNREGRVDVVMDIDGRGFVPVHGR